MTNEHMIQIANDHGLRATLNISGGVDVHVPFTWYLDNNTTINGIEIFPVNNLHQLKLALGY